MSLLYFRSSERSLAVSSPSLIKRGVLERLVDVDELLLDADAIATSLRESARQDAEDALAVAREEGFRRGREEGLVAILGTLEIERRMLDLLADRIGRVVEQCIRSMVGQVGLAELFGARIQHAVSTLTPDGQATLHVAPGQAHLAQEALAQLAARSGGDLRWISVRVDERCPADEFVIETPLGFIDARLKATLDDARRIIEQAIRRAGDRLPLPPSRQDAGPGGIEG